MTDGILDRIRSALRKTYRRRVRLELLDMNPVFAFRCLVCEHEHDLPGRPGWPPPDYVSCPRCGSERNRRIYTAPTVAFLGNGWTGGGKRKRK